MRTSLQVAIDQQRAVYSHRRRPRLSQLAQLHGLTVRDFARIFDVSKSYADDILRMRVRPPLERGVDDRKVLRSHGRRVTGRTIHDSGERRPLVIELPGNKVVRLKAQVKDHGSMELIRQVAEAFQKQDAEG